MTATASTRDIAAAPRRLRVALLGFGAIAANVAGVLALADQPAAYRIGAVSEWAAQLAADRAAAAASAIGFIAGMVLLAAFVAQPPIRIERRARRAMIAGCVINAAGSALPLALASGVLAGEVALRAAVWCDAAFNLSFGVGLMLVAAADRREARLPSALLAALAGVCTVPVAAQAVSSSAASLLAVAGPLWLAWIAVRAISVLRGRLEL